MAYPPGMEYHGSGWRINKSVPTDLKQHYNTRLLRYQTKEPDKKKAANLAWRWLADLDEEFKRLRETGSKYKTMITPQELEYLVNTGLHTVLRYHEKARAAKIFADDATYSRYLQDLAEGEADNRLITSRGIVPEHFQENVQNLLLHFGYDIPADSPEFLDVCTALSKGKATAIVAQRERVAGNWVDTPAIPIATKTKGGKEDATRVLMLSGVIEHFLSKQREDAPMFKKYKGATTLLLEVLGNRPVSSLKQQEIDDFFSLICRLPPRWTDKKRQLGKTARELAAMDWDKSINRKTFEDSYMAALRPFFIYARRVFGDQGFPSNLTTEGIKYQGAREGGENKQRAFRPDELKRLFEGVEYVAFARDPAQEHAYWLPLLGLFTGARVNELCQLNPQCDIREEHGIWLLDITDESDTAEGVRKSVKNNASRRKVPIHSILLKLGFLRYVQKMKAQGEALLFPQWPPVKGKASGKAEKWFRGLLDSLKLRDETPKQRLVGFHAMRSTLLSRADHLDIPKPGTLTGHRQASDNATEAGYKEATALTKNRDKLEKLYYDLTFPPLER